MARAETETWGYNHAELGQAVADSWNLPGELTTTIGFHAGPLFYEGTHTRIICTLYAADYICQENGLAFGAVPLHDRITLQKCLKRIDVKPKALELIFNCMKSELSKMQYRGLF
jgi:hypothetical protein